MGSRGHGGGKGEDIRSPGTGDKPQPHTHTHGRRARGWHGVMRAARRQRDRPKRKGKRLEEVMGDNLLQI